MFIQDFHSKLVSAKKEGRLFEVLRKLKDIESPTALMTTDGAWSVWTTDDSYTPLATAES